jgi:diguanylate cyclase (GGDEF)-like protein
MKKRILIVDDEPYNLDILRIFLESLNYDLLEANNGTEAFQIILQNMESIDLILLDVMMPDISGISICRELQLRNRFHIPIIFLSAKVEKEDVLLGLQSGAFDYLTKPFDLDLLEKKIFVALQYKEKYGELKIENVKLTDIAFKDGLTGLYNHFHLNEIRNNIDKGLQQYDAILLIDIDNFKQINDAYGHLWGDKVISRLSEIIKSNIADDDKAFRYGGDEFLVLLRHSSMDRCYQIAEAIHSGIVSHSFVLNTGRHFSVTVSIGVATSMKGESYESLFDRVDQSLLEAKHDGRNVIRTAKEI